MIQAYIKKYTKISSSIFLLALSVSLVASLFSVLPVQASSLFIGDNLLNEKVGKTFTLPVLVNPASEKSYTMRLHLSFPADLVEVVSFAFAPNWMPVPQPGYDLKDNIHGELIKTAGYPAGFSAATPFGTVTFRAKRSGSGIITVGAKTFVLNAENKSSLQSRPQIRLIVASPTPTSASAPVAPTTSLTTTSADIINTVEPLPNLPAEPENLFDIISEPAQTETPRPLFTFVAFVVGGILLMMGILFFLVRMERKWVLRTLKKETKRRQNK